MPKEENLDGCELDFDLHPTKGTEIEDYLIEEGAEEDEDDA